MNIKSKQEEKIIPHKDAPSGVVKFYRYKEPFMKNPEPYFGFQGVLLHDAKEPLIQCSECGQWFKSLGWAHLKTHNLNARSYKTKFGLQQTTALINEEFRNELIKNGNIQKKFLKGGKPFVKNDPRLKNRSKAPREMQNMAGTCPAQILEQMNKFKEKLGRQPSYNEFCKKHVSLINPIRKVYGSWANACKLLGWKVQPSHIGFNKFEWSAEKLIQAMRIFKETNGREPARSDERRGLIPNNSTYYRFFGKSGWTKAKDIAFNREQVI